MRTTTLAITVFSAVTAASIGLGIGLAGTTTSWTADDDISNYDGTACAPNQFYDATDGTCAAEAVTNGPQGVPDTPLPGISDPGTQCKEGQFYDVAEQQCLSDAITNNPDATITPQGEDPADYTVPGANGVPNCARNPADPMWNCA